MVASSCVVGASGAGARSSWSRASWHSFKRAPLQSTPAPPPPHSTLVEAFEVVHQRVMVRESPRTDSPVVAVRTRGDTVVAEERSSSGWIRVSAIGWMLLDGTVLGLGPLLQPLRLSRLRASAQPHELRLRDSGQTIELRGGVRMPLLGMGTGGVPGLEGKTCVTLVTHALRSCGVRLIDTAADYQNEEEVGEAIRQSGVPRSELFVVTKLGPLWQGEERARASVLRSLQRLGLDYLDLVVVHWPGAWVEEQRTWSAADWMDGRGSRLARELRAGSWRALEQLKADGMLRFCGVSNYTPTHLLELLRSCRVPPDVCQSELHPFFANAQVRQLCAQNGIAFMAYGPLAGGPAERAAGLRGVHNPTVCAMASSVGRTPAQVLLRWATQRGVCVLPKSRRLAGVEENAGAHGFDLSEGQLAALDALNTGRPTYWDPQCVDVLDHFNVFLDKQRLQQQLAP